MQVIYGSDGRDFVIVVIELISCSSNCWLFSLQVSEWEAVVYGKTEDQLIMTEQARQYLNPYTSSGSTSRALVL